MNELIKQIEPEGKLSSKGLAIAGRLCRALEAQLSEVGIEAREYVRYHEFIGSTVSPEKPYDTPEQHIGTLIQKVREGLYDALVLGEENKEYSLDLKVQNTRRLTALKRRIWGK